MEALAETQAGPLLGSKLRSTLGSELRPKLRPKLGLKLRGTQLGHLKLAWLFKNWS